MSPAAASSFGRDLRVALLAWRRFPWLPAVSVGLAAIGQLPVEPAFLLVLGLTSLLNAGWVGTERICYLRAFRGRQIRVRELWRLTRAFLGRYLVLGISVTILLIVLGIGVSVADALTEFPSERLLGAYLVALYIVVAVVDVALTFVTPALAFSTRRVRQALGIGLKMIRSEWPASAWYVVVPPLAAVLIAQVLTRTSEVPVGIQLLTSAFATLLNLWFKGATAAFYLRRHEVGDDGAAFAPGETRSDKSRSTAAHEEGLFLREDEAEDLGRIRDLGTLIAVIEQVSPEGGILYLEGTTIAPDVVEFLESHQVSRPVPVAKGTIWLKPRMFHVAATPANLRRLADLGSQHAAPEVCDHLVLYRDEEVLLTAYDSGSGRVFVSKQLAQSHVDELLTLLARGPSD